MVRVPPVDLTDKFFLRSHRTLAHFRRETLKRELYRIVPDFEIVTKRK